MSWIKRNLSFVAGAIATLALLGAAIFYCFSSWNLNKENLKKLDEAHATLEGIKSAKPNPGNDRIDNTEVARRYQAQIQQIIDKVQKYFLPIPGIPPGTNIMDRDFDLALDQTIAELNEAASKAGVTLPNNFTFTFKAQVDKAVFAPGSLEPLAQQLGEIKTICTILFNAQINALYNLRRERVSNDDLAGVQTDYLETKSVTNDLAVLTPYEVKFSCFSGELANVLTGFANQPHGFVVKTLNVEPDGAGDGGATAPAPVPNRPPPSTSGFQDVLDEKRLRVTLMLNLVKLLPPKTTN